MDLVGFFSLSFELFLLGVNHLLDNNCFLMDGDEAKESALDCASNAATAMCLDASCEHESTQSAKKQQKRKRASSELDIVDKESASAEWQRELDALYEYYKEVSGHHMNLEELACLMGDSIIACLLEESSLPCAELTDKIYKRFKLQDGVTVPSVTTWCSTLVGDLHMGFVLLISMSWRMSLIQAFGVGRHKI